MGLAISRQLVEMMEGEIGIESEVSRGSTFWFTALLEKQPGDAVVAPGCYADAGDLRGLRAFIVDDNATNRSILHRQIVSWGMRNGSAEDAPGALEKLRAAASRGEPYDLVILDREMPEMDGLELAKQIKADPSISSVRLVLLTSLRHREDSQEARQVGIAATLTKPVRQSQLFDCLATVMGPPVETSPTPSVDAPLTADHVSEEAEDKRHNHVLLAEDNAVNQRVALRMLEKRGYRVDVAKDGLEAVEALSRIPYTAVLMDCQMPNMDGYEATREIRRREYEIGQRRRAVLGPNSRARRVPIIAMTAHALQGGREKCLVVGMDDYIAKPVKPEELDVVLKRWIPKPALTREAPAPETGDAAALDEVVDHGVLAGLRELQREGEPDILGELIEAFLKDAPTQLAALREAATQEKAKDLERVSHALKGSSGSLGARRMVSICEELETLGRRRELAHVSVLLARLEAEFERVREALVAEVGS